MSRFLRVCAFLSVCFFATNAFAAGYTCDSYKVYSSCNAGYYLSNGSCSLCSLVNNTTSKTSCTKETSITGGKRIGSGTKTCNGKYTGGNAGSNGTSQCTGCSSYSTTCTVTSYSCSCNSGYHASGSGSSCTCVPDCSTSKSCSSSFSGYSGTYNECTQNQSSQCYKSCSVTCSGNDTCPANATCTYNTSYKYTGTQYYGGSCSATAGKCPVSSFTCNTGWKKNSAGTACVPNSYTVTFDLVGGYWGATPNTVTVTSGDYHYIVYDGFPTKAGYTFGGFYTGQNCTGTQYFSKENDSYYGFGSLLPFTSDTALYACWNKCPEGSYCPGGHIGGYEYQQISCSTVPLEYSNWTSVPQENICPADIVPDHVAEGAAYYTQACYRTGSPEGSDAASDCTGVGNCSEPVCEYRGVVSCDTGWKIDSAGTACEKDNVTIKYYYNGGTQSGTPSSVTCQRGLSCELQSGSTNKMYRAGYKFVGWNTSSTATTGYTTITPTGDTNVYAIWEKCAAGTYHPNSKGTTADTYANVCIACAKGTYQNETGKSSCKTADSGYYVSTTGAKSQSACTSWRANTNTNGATGSTSSSACVCAAGYRLNGSSCTACSAGTYKSANSNATSCTNVDDGCYGGANATNACPNSCSDLNSFYTKSDGGRDANTDCYGTTTPGEYIETKKSGQVTCAADGFCPGSVKVYYNSTGGRTACSSFNSSYPYSDQGTTSSNYCYASKTNTGSQNPCKKPENCYSVTCNSCTPGTCSWRDYYNATDTTCTPTDCDQKVKSVTANANYYVNGTSCSACNTIGDKTYTSSVAGNSGGTGACFKSCTKACTQKSTPTGAYSVTHGTTSTSGTHYYGGSCSASSSTCSLTVNSCDATYYKNGNACSLCSGLADGLYPNSNAGNSSGTDACYTNSLSGKVIATKNAKTTTDCDSKYYKSAHTVNYGSTSSCNSCPATASGSDSGRDSNKDCYVSCSAKSISNGTTTTVNAKEYYNGSAYPACTYNVNCNAKHGASGNKTTNPACTVCAPGKYSAGGTNTCADCQGRPDNSAYTGNASSIGGCPWSCNDGYNLTSDNQCGQFCTSGITHIHLGNGLTIPLYNSARTSPAINVKWNNSICYGSLETGQSSGALNVKFGDTTYHATN